MCDYVSTKNLAIAEDLLIRAKDFREEAQKAGLWDREYIQKHHEGIVNEAEFYIRLTKMIRGVR